MFHLKIQPRSLVVCLAAAAVALPIALISIAKLLLVLCALACLIVAAKHPATAVAADPQTVAPRYTPIAVVLALALFAISLIWTTGPQTDALGSLAKYGKLLSIVLMAWLIRSRPEAFRALGVFLIAQAFLVLSSWLLFFHVTLPWATASQVMVQHEFAVFSTYLDQSLITVATGAICWHLRHTTPWRHGPRLLTALAAVCFLNVLFVLSGRTGHVVAIALLSLAIMWELPRRWRPAVLVLPFVLFGALFLASDKVRDRLHQATTEVQAYSQPGVDLQNQTSSSGFRLQLWTSSLKMIAAHPVVGTGIGSWSTEYNRQSVEYPGRPLVGSNFNPHQEYLLWGVQLGLPGIAMFIALLLALVADGARMTAPVGRALQSTVAALAVACCFNSSIYDALIGDYFCVTLGLLLALGAHMPHGARRAA